MKLRMLVLGVALSLGAACGEPEPAVDPVPLSAGLTLQEQCQVLQDYFDRAEFNNDSDLMSDINDQMERTGCYG